MKLAAIVQLLCDQGADCTVISCRNGDMNVHIKISGNNSVVPIQKIVPEAPTTMPSEESEGFSPSGDAEESAENPLTNIVVPREDSVGNRVVANARHNIRKSPVRYTRTRTPMSVQSIDKKYKMNEVRELVRLRAKNLEGAETLHLRNVASQKLGCGNFVNEKLSNKEILVLLSIAEGKSLPQKLEYILKNYNIGEDAKSTMGNLYIKFNMFKRYAMKTECVTRFFGGEVVDLNKSVQYFIDVDSATKSRE